MIGMGPILFFKYQKLASYIIENDDQNLGKELPDRSVPSQQIHRNQQDQGFQYTGADPAGHKFGKFGDHRLFRPVVAFKDKGFVGQIGKGYGHDPGQNIADRGRQPQPIEAWQVNDVIYQSGQAAKKEIRNDVFVFM